MGAGKTTPPVLAAIEAATNNARVRLAMIFGALEEGGSLTGPWGAGDSGQSHGPFQIYHVAHPSVSTAEAEDPTFAVHYMLHSYEEAVKHTPRKLWRTNPGLAIEDAAYRAERPAETYIASRGSKQVQDTYGRAVAYLANNPATATDPQAGGQRFAGAAGEGAAGTGQARTDPAGFGGGGFGQAGSDLLHGDAPAAIGDLFKATAGDLLNPLLGIFNVSSFQDLAERAALIIFGALLVIVGLVMAVKDTGIAKAGEEAGLLYATGGASATRAGATRSAVNKTSRVKAAKAAT